ncbi:MAG: RhuM family protein [Candidatus Shapirobacteria bacterium]|nr:RhuM family protein [Candidatus Shapirobacteria bacterium]
MKKIINETKRGEVTIYKSTNGPVLDVHLDKNTVWLSLDQMSALFDRDKSVVSRHIKNVFTENELLKSSVVANYATTASDGKKYNVDYYNLDVIISVGYRVKSLCGTQFRIWATKTLKQHLIQGYTINQKRLLQVKNNLEDLQQTILFLKEKSGNELLAGQEKEILNILANYSKTLTFLSKYDKDELKLIGKSKGKFILDYSSARNLIDQVKSELSTVKSYIFL